MGMPLEELHILLLDLLSTRRDVSRERVAQLAQADWAQLMAMLHQHRLGPLLHWRLRHERAALAVPEPIRVQLADSFRQATLRALRFQRELVLLTQVMAQAGIAALALKGAYLAYHAYPHPAMRPLRDLDLLVRQEDALAAYQALLDAGYQRCAAHPGDPAASIAVRKHLPPLRSKAGVTVELHVRLSDPSQAVAIDEEGHWQRAIGTGTALRYLSQTDLMLHLICHALYDHRLDNGPLVLPDLACLIAGGQIDWPLFWQQAQASGATRGCVLMLALCTRYFDVPMPACPAGCALDDAQLAGFAPLMLCNLQPQRADLRLALALAGQPWRTRMAILFERLFPARAKLASLAPTRSRALYARHAWRIATERLPQFLAGRRWRAADGGVGKQVELEQWLAMRGPGATP
ncbi:MAG: nucleotidyltransferase family protein [Pseudomonadota bacterium]